MDRNLASLSAVLTELLSLSARRAWIEIHFMLKIGTLRSVALRKESVDRNCYFRNDWPDFCVALRKESVDRNVLPQVCWYILHWSLSARRAWIEIGSNLNMLCSAVSLSARRAWIEIAYGALDGASEIVALRKESVDRNYIIKITGTAPRRRSPQGERG